MFCNVNVLWVVNVYNLFTHVLNDCKSLAKDSDEYTDKCITFVCAYVCCGCYECQKPDDYYDFTNLQQRWKICATIWSFNLSIIGIEIVH